MSKKLPSGWDLVSEGRQIKIDYANKQIIADGVGVFEDYVQVHSTDFNPEFLFTVVEGEIQFINNDAGELFAFYNDDCVYSIKGGDITFFSPHNGEFKAYRQHVGSIELVVDNMDRIAIIGSSEILSPATKFSFASDNAGNMYGVSAINFYNGIIEVPSSHRHSTGVIMTKINNNTLEYSSVVVMGNNEVERYRKLLTIIRESHFARITIEDLPVTRWMSDICSEFDLVHNPNNYSEEIWQTLEISPLYQGNYVFVSIDKDVFFKFDNIWVLMDQRQIKSDRRIPSPYLSEYNMFKSIRNT